MIDRIRHHGAMLLLAVFYCVTGLSPVAAAAPLVIGPGLEAADAFPRMHSFHDEAGNLPVAAVNTRFLSAQNSQPTAAGERYRGVVWYVADLANGSGSDLAWGLRLEFVGTRTADLFILDPANPVSEVLTVAPVTNHGRFVTFPVMLPAEKTRRILLRVYSPFAHRPVRIAMATERALLDQVQVESIAVGAYYGIAFATILFNLGLFFAGGRHKTSLYYAMFVGTLLFYLLVFDGYADVIFSGKGFWKESILAFASLPLLAAFVYSRAFLSNAGGRPPFYPVFRILTGVAWLIFAAASLSALLPASVAYGMGPFIEASLDLLAVVGLPVLALAGLEAVRRGYRPAYFYVLGWTAISVLQTLWIMARWSIIPTNALTYNGLHLASSFEIILMSVAVAYQFYELRRERAAAQQSVARSQAVAQTAQMLVHDIRRPFSLIDQMLERLTPHAESTPFRDIFHEYLGTIREQIKATQGLTANLLDVNSTQPVHVESFNFHGLVRSVRDQVFMDTPWKIEENRTDREIVADRAKLQRVLANIFENARDAQPGAGSLRVTLRDVTDRRRRFWQVEIANDGPVIPVKDQARIFDAHFTKGKAHGSGLGLAICRNIVERHGGTIGVQSRPRETKFFFTLPVRDVVAAVSYHHERPRTVPAELISTHQHQASPVIAVIDDCPFIRQLWETTVEDAEVVTFASVGEFRARLSVSGEEDLTCVVSDLSFGDGRSIDDMLSEVSRLAGELSVPVFISSDFQLYETPAGVSAMLAKRPFSLAELNRHIGGSARGEISGVRPGNDKGKSVS